MRILLITQVLPYPPDSGPKIKTWNLLKHLSQRHEVTLVSFTRGDQSEAVRQLEPFCARLVPVPLRRSLRRDGWALARSLATGIPWVIARDTSRTMRQVLASLAANQPFDIVHADQLNMAAYAHGFPQALQVLDAHNALWLLYRRLAGTLPWGLQMLLWARDWRLLRRYEGAVCREMDGVFAVSPSDRDALGEVSGSPDRIRVVPITVDLEETQPVHRSPRPGHLLSLGTMFWPPNVEGVLWFARQVWPRIHRECPEAVFDIAGARPPRAVQQLAGEAAGIRVHGYVDDPASLLEQAAALVVPLHAGGGMRVKILQALAQEVPVVTTRLGCEGISAEHDRHLLIAGAPQEFARQTLRLLNDPELGRRLGSQGRQLIRQQYDARACLGEVEAAYQDWIFARKPRI